MPNKTLTFKTDILPYSDGEFNLGNSSAKWKVNGYVINTAATKDVDTSIAEDSASTNLPTSAAVASFVDGKGYIESSQKGAVNGIAELDASGKVPSSQLPSYVDDVREYANRDAFPLSGTSGIIYVAEDTNLTYRWSGSEYVVISESLALGTTASTAYRGDYGSVAYQHATDNNRLTTAQPVGLYKFSTTDEGHVKSVTAVEKSDITALGVIDDVVAVQTTQPTSSDTKLWIKENASTSVQVPTVQEMNNAIAAVDVPVQDVQVNGTSILSNGVANMPVATANALGVSRPGSSIAISGSGALEFRAVGASEVKAGTSYVRALTPERQHASAFYGLAKAAGADMASSSNPVGTYTEAAKSAISQMLNAPVTVSGTTPTINAQAGVRYICGKVATITINPPASGCIDVIFTSGSTAAVLTVPNTVKWPDWFDPTALEANRTYEVNIQDGFGVVASWT